MHRTRILAFLTVLFLACSSVQANQASQPQPSPAAPTAGPKSVEISGSDNTNTNSATTTQSNQVATTPQCSSSRERGIFPYLVKFCGDILKDGTEFKPGETVRNVWRIRNDGTETWTQDFSVDLVYGAFDTTFPTRLPLGQEVKPGEEIEIPIQFPAPNNPKDY